MRESEVERRVRALEIGLRTLRTRSPRATGIGNVRELPSGGTQSQVLTKASNNSGDVVWGDVDPIPEWSGGSYLQGSIVYYRGQLWRASKDTDQEPTPTWNLKPNLVAMSTVSLSDGDVYGIGLPTGTLTGDLVVIFIVGEGGLNAELVAQPGWGVFNDIEEEWASDVADVTHKRSAFLTSRVVSGSDDDEPVLEFTNGNMTATAHILVFRDATSISVQHDGSDFMEIHDSLTLNLGEVTDIDLGVVLSGWGFKP